MSDCFICVTNQALKLSGSATLKANANLASVAYCKAISTAKINISKIIQPALVKTVAKASGKVRVKANLAENIFALNQSQPVTIKSPLIVSGSVKSKLLSKSSINNKYTDKFAGNIDKLKNSDFASVQKLYPIADIVTSLNNSYFVDKQLSSGNLYQSIDEGVFVGNYHENLNKSNRISDDNNSFIQPSSVFTSGTFRYKCEVTRPYHHPSNSFLFVRASAPLSNYGSNVPPEYRIHNIKFEDPSGNIIVKYKDIILRGDADYSSSNINYSTYITEPEINNANLRTWEPNYPIFWAASGYTLSLDFDVMCLDDPFNIGFNEGYEEKACELKFVDTGNNDYIALDGSPLSTQTQGYHLNPTNTIRISSIEICNSGDLCSSCFISGIKHESYFNFYTEVSLVGQRLSRTIYPVDLFTNSYDVDIYPEGYSTWSANSITNATASGSKSLVSRINNLSNDDYISLSYNSPVSDSGRLTLKFSHQPPPQSASLTDGAFDFSSDASFDRANLKLLGDTDNFFVVDDIELRIVAKKATGSRDYVLDVVGYSDDRILNITPKIGAFLQNTQAGSGNVPLTSGFYSVDDLGISSESISDKGQYHENYLTSIDAGDHYKLSTLPIVSGTEFKEYSIPLSIYEDYVTVGKSKDYSMSSYFENLYIDLYPIPSGASIASVRLIVTYKPSNGMMLHTLGTPTNKELGLKDIKLLPVGRTKNSDILINTDAPQTSLSLVSGIPQAYGEPVTLKTNYARRWRGVDGNIVNGPYDPNEFDFSYYNPQANYPFLNGYYNLNHTSGNYILSDDYANSGYYNGNNSVLKNIGWRFNNTQLFSISTPYTSLDWATSVQPLNGIICDAFDSALRVSGQLSNINLGNTPLDSGFAFYLRFTPDIGMSGYNNPLFNSGVLASKWDSGKGLEFALGYKNGYLSVLAKDKYNSIVELNDTTPYDEYQFPLSILVTHIPGSPSGALRLYCNNEIFNNVQLRDEDNVAISGGDSNLIIGHSYGSGIGSNIFVHEFGVSYSGNIVHANPNRLLKQTTALSFLDGHSHSFLSNTSNNTRFKLHEYVNDDTSAWKLGSYKTCSFSPDFDGFTTRIGKDYIIHRLKHSGSGYHQVTNLPLPSSINASGLAYHTQIENDFLRFNLQDIPDVNPEFYSTLPRICKTLPRGYDFKERALVVDTVIEHETNNDILWPDGSIGPKLIVSLYSKNQNPVDRPSKTNWGLINRAIHYLEPSGCYEKISSTFNYNDLVDISEPWAKFDLDNVISEFDQKYYSTDINDMFLQYDLVYPSGSPFESIIKLHSANVRLENALTYFANSNSQVNLYASGESISLGSLNLYSYGLDSIGSGLVLYTSGSPWSTSNNSINLFASGVFGIPNSQFNLFVKNSGEISTLGPNLYVSGGYPRDTQHVNLVMINNILDQTRTNSVNIFLKNTAPVYVDSTMALSTPEVYSFINFFRAESLNLFTGNNEIILSNSSSAFNLYTFTDLGYSVDSGNFNLFTMNYLAFNQNLSQQAVISWNRSNVGKSIDAIIDSGVPYLLPNDEIRGVDLLCFGECGTIKECKEKPILLHDIDWYGEQSCIDGGIFRVKNTYTNLAVSGFKTPIPYSGNFYGIRKYDGLIPNAPYNITISTKTGSHVPIKLPTKYIEADYGSNDYVNYSGVKLAADFGLSESERSSGNLYGHSVAAKYDLVAIGSPKQTVSYSEYDSSGNLITTNLEEAGAVYLYRREARPSGYSWADDKHKSPWLLETMLTLPSGMLKDYPTSTKRYNINGIAISEPIIEKRWNVGQEGRQFGSSLDLAINKNISSFKENNREILVVGGPTAKWNRNFDDLSTSGVSIGLVIFTDEFRPGIPEPLNPKNILTYKNILEAIANKDLVFRYFSDPPVRFDVKIIICEPLSSDTNITTLDFPEPKPSFITKQSIPRNEGITPNTQAIFSGIKSAFESTFPYDTNKINNNIPVMLGVYVDNSRSLGRQAVSPGLDQFIQYYQQYSFASGLRDFNNVPSSGAVYEYIPPVLGSENWVYMSNIILNELLDTGRLVSDNQVRFFASDIGPDFFNENLSEFNYPPASGGRVYVFEKESGVWNLIQELQSPNLSYDTIDRFGHAVAISENTNIISVGSPYINECCKIYQYRPTEKQRLFDNLYSWLTYKSSFVGGTDPRYIQLINEYETWSDTYSITYANEILYSKLTPTEKFEARKYLNIGEYENIFTYSYKDIPYVGTWDFIPKTFAPSSRLGYSTAVNDDGSIVAFGAPTDSFNVFDDYDVYYKNDGYLDPLNIDQINGTITPSWRSNVNAGAVRLFESREIYPHSKVVEYGKFGNLQGSLIDPLDSGHFNYLSTIFQNRSFRKMNESEVSIPEDAGLAFIITPGVDAASEEVIDSLISWLSLGDRNLVIVGNDPIWEADGAYKTSNDIVNKILDNLNSKMRLYPARNIQESLPSGNSSIVPSFKPSRGTQTYVKSFNINTGYGVADIRMHFPGFSRYMPCSENSLNDKCELPLVHRGDLRAQWLESCADGLCSYRTIQYPVNWPFIFKTFTPDCCEVELVSINEGRFDLENQDPVPILAAGETTVSQRVIPGTPDIYQYIPITEDRVFYTSQTIYEFDDANTFSSTSFVWNSGTNGYSSYEANVNGVITNKWYKPELFEDRQSILQATATPLEEVILSSQVITNFASYCVEQTVGSSKIIAIAGVETESQNALMSGTGDGNINLYINLVSKNQFGQSTIAQLGGWTGRSSFVDAYDKSILRDRFIYAGNDVNLDVQNLSVSDDVCWIANPKNLPSTQDIANILSWLNNGDKKLVITHDNTLPQIRIVSTILSLLGTDIEPVYLSVKDQYAVTSYSFLSLNTNHPVSIGFGVYPIQSFEYPVYYTPFADNANVTKIAYANSPVYDDKLSTNEYWQIDSGLDKVVFSGVAGSGYKMFIDTISETPYENYPVQVYVKNGFVKPGLPSPDPTTSTSVVIPSGRGSGGNYAITNVGYINSIPSGPLNKIQTTSFNIQLSQESPNIEMFFNSFAPRITTATHIPKSVRIVGVSGVLLPINSSVSQTGRIYKEVLGYNKVKIADAVPEIIESQLVTRQISTLNDKYCVDEECAEFGFNNQYIADGPVVVAQEIESVSSFNAGITRSRITLISDSSLVQGRFMSDEFGRMSAETVSFIESLYPQVDFPQSNGGRQYSTITKIVAPERGSPQKYFALSNKNGNVQRFYVNGNPASLSVFTDKESLYDPRYVLRSELPWTNSTPEVVKELLKSMEIETFENLQQNYGATARFSGIIDGTLYGDIGIEGGIPQIMKDTGSDYLDFDKFPSGYPGDLFGFSLSLHKNKLVVGSPFAGFSDENVNRWIYYVGNNGQSGIQLSQNGGAGSVYVFEKTFNGSGIRNTKTPWEFMQKLRPSEINVGQDISDSGLSQNYNYLGPNTYSSGQLSQLSNITDQFGYDVSIDSDIIVVGAPGHDFEKYTNNIYDSGQFIRKAFNEEFDIPSRTIIDFGNSGVRYTIGSGLSILNNGAIFSFENRIVDWQTREQKWTFVEKLLQQGNNSRTQNSNENDYFGKSVYVHRSNRSDSDYIVIGGTSNHDFSSSGAIVKNNAGAAYLNDIMLRESSPAIANSGAYISVNVFGERDNNGQPNIRTWTTNTISDQIYRTSGIIYTNQDGAIFLEASGQDPATNGFIIHRPYVMSVDGLYYYGTENSNNIPLFIDGNVQKSENINLVITSTTGNVYNNLGLYNSAIVDFGSGVLNFYTDCPEPIQIFSSGLPLFMASGIGISTDTLNMRIRGY